MAMVKEKTKTRREPYLDPLLLSNPEKILFPADGITKKELGDYYARIAPLMLPLIKDHPLSMQRFPDGIDHEGFYQKNVGSYFPDFIDRIKLKNNDGTYTVYPLAQNMQTLVYLAYQASITLHAWLSRCDKIDYPDRMIFDFDPGEKTLFSHVKHHVLAFKKLLDAKKLVSFVMTTGSRGLHVVVPLRRTKTYAFVHEYAHELARTFAAQNPAELTVEMRKETREGRLFIDFMRNTYGHTAVAPYAVRPKNGAPVATPLLWSELQDPHLNAQTYTVKNIFARLEKTGDVWHDFHKTKNRL